MTRQRRSPRGELIDDIENNPQAWEKVDERREPSRGRAYRGGISVNERFRKLEARDEPLRHTIYDSGGLILHQHWARPEASHDTE
jgi:hypothetical protein